MTTEAALLAWLKPKLAIFKMPREIMVVEAIPRLANGKIDRVTLQREASQESFAQ
jgi:fatty-acyl-CoA synthase